MDTHTKKNLLGVCVDAIDYKTAQAEIIAAAQQGKNFAVSALAVYGVMGGVFDLEQRYRLNHLDLVTPDGQPVRWALNWLYQTHLPDRVYGPELMLRLCRQAAEIGLPVYFFGSHPETLRRLCANLHQKFPHLQIAGCRPSYFRRLAPDENETLRREIYAGGAKLVFVGLGCPRQEVWIYEQRLALAMPLIAVGAAFDFIAGTKPQAPHWMQKRGLEWCFRLIHEPRRLWQRYLIYNPLFILLFLLQCFRLKRFVPERGRVPIGESRYG